MVCYLALLWPGVTNTRHFILHFTDEETKTDPKTLSNWISIVQLLSVRERLQTNSDQIKLQLLVNFLCLCIAY